MFKFVNMLYTLIERIIMSCEFYPVSRVKSLDIKLPERSTANSAGYDFFAFEDITIPSFTHTLFRNIQLESYDGCSRGITSPFCIKTGVKASMDMNMCLQLYPRSSWPSKLGLVMANSVGIIDSDYFDNPDNEGEIGFLVYNITNHDVHIRKGDKLGQGIFTKFYITDSDNASGIRVGGFGSTGV